MRHDLRKEDSPPAKGKSESDALPRDAAPSMAHALDWETIAASLETDVARGLTTSEAAVRLARHGPNQLAETPPAPWWRRLLEQLSSTLVLILIAATVISSIEWWLQDPRETDLPYEAIVILAIIVLNALLGYVQEARAERSVKALMALAAPETTVLRDGERSRIPAHDIVPGDLLLVEAGDRVPADARLIETASLATDEAALTGESLPVTKSSAAVAAAAGIGDRIDMLFSGTVVTHGRGRAIVVATGMATEVGRIADLLSAETNEATPLQQELDRTGKRLSVIMLAICLVVFATGLWSSPVTDLKTVLSLFLFAVALAVAAIPEALPAIVTVGLSLGVRRMAAANAIVRRLPAVETLGAATVICSDKTGTLTRNEMTVRVVITAGSEISVGGSGYVPEGAFTVAGAPLGERPDLAAAVRATLTAAALANDAALVHRNGRWRIEGDPTEGALVVAARKLGLDEKALQRLPRISEIPFTSERKRHATLHADADHPGELEMFLKGAPEAILGRCSHVLEPDGPRPLDDAGRRRFLEAAEELGRRALRVLAVARRSVTTADLGLASGNASDTHCEPPEALEQGLVLLGLAGMIDPPRDEVKAAIATARAAHIRVVMITGDHPSTAEAIARELDILEADHDPGIAVVTGARLAAMSDTDLDRIVEHVRVFARVDPEHKLRIVGALQKKGHIVAMTGDGINDAPALRRANIGIAMGITGTDVSKEAADMVLADDNFASIVKAIEEGRGIFDNIRKYLVYLLSSNAGELLTMFVGVMLAAPLGLVPAEPGVFLPLLAVQLLWINLVTDGPPALALGIDPKAADVMRRRPRRSGSGILLASDWLWLGGIGLLMMAGTLAVLDAYYPGGLVTLPLAHDLAPAARETHARTMAFTTLMAFQLVNVFCCRSTYRSAFAGCLENYWLIGAVGVSLVLHLAVVYVPALQVAFQTAPLSASDWLVALAVASTLLLSTELAKAGLRRAHARRRAAPDQAP